MATISIQPPQHLTGGAFGARVQDLFMTVQRPFFNTAPYTPAARFHDPSGDEMYFESLQNSVTAITETRDQTTKLVCKELNGVRGCGIFNTIDSMYQGEVFQKTVHMNTHSYRVDLDARLIDNQPQSASYYLSVTDLASGKKLGTFDDMWSESVNTFVNVGIQINNAVIAADVLNHAFPSFTTQDLYEPIMLASDRYDGSVQICQ